jgi:hypothetical protein
MHSAHARNMFRLFGEKVILLLAVLCCALPAEAQKFSGGGNYNFLDFNQKPYYFGITLGMNSSRYKPFRSSEFFVSDSIGRVESIGGPGFNLGIVTNLKIGDYFDFRFLPTLSFAERNIEYRLRAPSTGFSLRRVESVFVEMPFQMRYKSAPYRDMRLFVIGGVKYAFDVASNSRAKQADNLVKIAPSDFSLEYGAGIQIFFPFFIFSPEFKISQGLGNTLIYNPRLEEASILEKLLSRSFTISLHFEG